MINLPSVPDIIAKYCPDNISVKDLRLIIAHIKSLLIEKIIFKAEDVYLDPMEMQLLLNMLDRYKKNEPLSKIFNNKSFWSHNFFVNSQVLDPRPETELIIETILSQFDVESPLNFLDIGTGSGCILLSLLWEYKKSYGVGIDVSANAISVAQYNQKKLGITNASFFAMDWSSFKSKQKFDIVVTNPPYVKTNDISQLKENVRNYDPRIALDGGPTGLDAYAIIAPLIARWLKPDGAIFLEIGYGQAEEVTQILLNNGLQVDEIRKDLNAIDRVIKAHLL
ncbi:MAG: peptide chain release factor N(5)-glutamine methyltransferase [Holosporaceae bacterium]|jgi:release factor glutamine methyltransferase|nr:peptide chain release factor N(5)-glutamine methyltransferase [Holosporaceae bacterium]